jgi:hypothetical protein
MLSNRTSPTHSSHIIRTSTSPKSLHSPASFSSPRNSTRSSPLRDANDNARSHFTQPKWPTTHQDVHHDAPLEITSGASIIPEDDYHEDPLSSNAHHRAHISPLHARSDLQSTDDDDGLAPTANSPRSDQRATAPSSQASTEVRGISSHKTPNVYINGLPPYFPEAQLYELTSPYGEVKSVRTFTRRVGERCS